jgi:hypothetical protein
MELRTLPARTGLPDFIPSVTGIDDVASQGGHMNERAVAYLVRHGVTKVVDGVPEWMLPLDKLQGFLDLLGPDDVAPGYEHIQQLYRAQAGAVRMVEEQITQRDH